MSKQDIFVEDVLLLASPLTAKIHLADGTTMVRGGLVNIRVSRAALSVEDTNENAFEWRWGHLKRVGMENGTHNLTHLTHMCYVNY